MVKNIETFESFWNPFRIKRMKDEEDMEYDKEALYDFINDFMEDNNIFRIKTSVFPENSNSKEYRIGHNTHDDPYQGDGSISLKITIMDSRDWREMGVVADKNKISILMDPLGISYQGIIAFGGKEYVGSDGKIKNYVSSIINAKSFINKFKLFFKSKVGDKFKVKELDKYGVIEVYL